MIYINGNFYQNPTFPTAVNPDTIDNYQDNRDTIKSNDDAIKYATMENIFPQNRGKKIKVYTSFPTTNEWKDKIFSGNMEYVNDYHLIISDPTNGNWYMIPISYINYIEFNEPINFSS